MKKSRILAIIVLVLILIGVYVLYGAFPSSNNTRDFTIPSGNYYYRFETVSLISASVEGSYSVSSGPPVTVKVFSQSEFDQFATTGIGTPITSTSGSSGSFSADLGGTGKMFIVFEHSSDTSEATVHMSLKISGIAMVAMVVGVVLLVVGIVIAVLGARMGRKEAAAIPPSPVATDVNILKKQ